MTGIAPSVWAEEGDRAIATAWELLASRGRAAGDETHDAEGRQMRG